MDNEEIQGVKFSEFPSATPANNDEVVGLHSGDNARFSVANFVQAIRQGLANIFVPVTLTVNNKALSSDIMLDASDVGAVDADDVGVAGGVAELDANGKVPNSQLPSIASTAADVTYDNTQSGLTADDVQEAIDELAAGTATGKADEDTIAPVEASTTATVAHPLGSVFYLEDVLYRALADIAVGGTINTGSGGNATQTTIAQNFKRVVTLTSAQYSQLSAAEKAADIVYIVTDDSIDYGDCTELIANIQSITTSPITVPSLSQFRYILATLDFVNGSTRNIITSNMIPASLFISGVGCQAEFYDGSARHYYVTRYYSDTQISLSSPTNMTGYFTGYLYGIK